MGVITGNDLNPMLSAYFCIYNLLQSLGNQGTKINNSNCDMYKKLFFFAFLQHKRLGLQLQILQLPYLAVFPVGQ